MHHYTSGDKRGAKVDELHLTPLELIDWNFGVHRRGLGATAPIPGTRATVVG
jgi:hypothetical protein